MIIPKLALHCLSIFLFTNLETYAYDISTSSRTTSSFQKEGAPSRRSFLTRSLLSGGASLMTTFVSPLETKQARAATFTPGGTLVDRELGIRVGNKEASASRAADNSNVLFGQDHYFKFGIAAPWIDESNVNTFPEKMPFAPSQQRYDALKKYGARVKSGLQVLVDLKSVIDSSAYSSIPKADSPEYALRAMGLLANSFLASENTGTTNELFLSRWYINEIVLAIQDMRSAPSADAALQSYRVSIKAANSYLNMMNRVITPKIGDKFELVGQVKRAPVDKPVDQPTAQPLAQPLDQAPEAQPLIQPEAQPQPLAQPPLEQPLTPPQTLVEINI